MLKWFTEGFIYRLLSTYIIIILAISFVAFLSLAFSDDETSAYFFTDKEAEQLRYSDKEWSKEFVARHKPDTLDRPSIKIEEPDVEDTENGPTILAVDPTNVFVQVKQNDSELDPGTIKVWGEKFFVKIDVTERMLKYFKTTKEGAIIHAKNIHIPHGHYKIGISIADMNGKKTEKKYRLKVE